MPTYAYACTSCDNQFDAVQSFSEPSLTECDACGGKLRKQYGSIGVTFNGSGFYRTDSRSGSKSASTSSSSGSGAESGAKASGSAGSKTEASSSPASSGS